MPIVSPETNGHTKRSAINGCECDYCTWCRSERAKRLASTRPARAALADERLFMQTLRKSTNEKLHKMLDMLEGEIEWRMKMALPKKPGEVG